MRSAEAPLLEARGIVKRFPGVLANDHVSLALPRGEIHALLGENGAGKTTLMNILYGLYQPDEGEILVEGQPVHFRSPRDAIERGIGMVHQHFMLVPPLTVADNVVLGNEPTRDGILLDREGAERRLKELARRYGMPVDPRARIRDLPVGVQQRVEILKALYRNAQVLILDEPTAVLSPQEANALFRVMRELARQGTSILFITHKLHEVFAVADRITVLRRGRVVGTTTPVEATEASLAAMMVGRPVLLRVDKPAAQPGPPLLQLRDLTVLGDRGGVAVDHIDLDVRAGEIVGIAGVEGNGQTELVEAIAGLRPVQAGRVLLNGLDLTGRGSRATIDAGVSHIPEDRHKYGLVLTFSVADNLVLSTVDQPPFSRGPLLNIRAILRFAARLIREFDIRTPSPRALAGTLSGGNQQKAVLAREFSRPQQLLIAAQPTRGVDVGSTEFIHRKIIEARQAGAAVLLVSAELDEVMSLSDRIAVMSNGQLAAIMDARAATPEQLGLLMAGGARRGSLGSDDKVASGNP